ncbi:hypothetical protein CSPX01_02797, partial [Colletotrichum filicis]
LLPWRIILPATAPLPDNSVWVFWFLQDTFLPCLLRYNAIFVHHSQYSDKIHPRKGPKGSWRRTTTAASPITARPPDLPTSSCPSPGELLQAAHRPQLPQTADHRRCADRSLGSSGATYTTHHHHQPRTAQRQPPPSPQLLLLLLLLPSHLSSPLSALILQLSQHHLA